MVERNLIISIRGGLGVDGLDGDKCVAVRRIRHDTYIQFEIIGGGIGARIQDKLQCVYRKYIHINGGQDGNLVIISTGGDVGVETHGVGSGSGIAGTIIYNGIAGIGSAGAFVDIIPAIGQVIGSCRSAGGGASPGIKVLHERKGGHVFTSGALTYHAPVAVIATTDASDSDIIYGIGIQTADGIWCGGYSTFRNPVGIIGAVFQLP